MGAVKSMAPEVVAHSILQYVDPAKLAAVMAECQEIELQKGPVATRNLPTESLYLLLHGQISLTNKVGQEILQVIPGRSIELGAVLDKKTTWDFNWFCQTQCTVLKIPWPKVEKFFTQNPLDFRYLKRVSTSVSLQKFKNDMVAMGVSKPAIRELIGSLKLSTYREALSNWFERVFVVIINGELRMHSEMGGRNIEVAQFRSTDTAMLNLPMLHVQFDTDNEAKVWYLRESGWNALTHAEEINGYFDIYTPAKQDTEVLDSDRTVVMSKFQTQQGQATPSRIEPVISKAVNLPLWLVRLRTFLIRRQVMVVPTSQSAFAALCALGSYFRNPLSLETLMLKFGSHDISRSLDRIKRIGAHCGLHLSVLREDTLGKNGLYPLVVPLLDEVVVIFARHQEYFEVSDFSSGQVRLIPCKSLEKLRSGKDVLVARGLRGECKVPRQKVPWLLLFRACFANPFLLVLLFVVGLAGFVMAYSMPVLQHYTIDSIQRGDPYEKIYFAIGAALILSVVGAVLNLLTTRIANYISLLMDVRIFNRSMTRMSQMDLESLRRIGLSQTVTRLFDIDHLANFGLIFGTIPINLAVSGMGIYFLSLLHPQFAVVSLWVIGGQFALSLVFLPTLQKYFAAIAAGYGNQRQLALEHLNSPQEIHGLDAFVSIRWRWDKILGKRLEMMNKVGIIQAIFRAKSELMRELMRLSLFWVMAQVFVTGQVSLGQVISATLVLMVLNHSLTHLFDAMLNWSRTKALFERLAVFFDEDRATEPESSSSMRRIFKGHITFKNVSFRYPGDQTLNILSNINLSFPAGSKICILGNSGSGKSTVAGILNGLIQPTSGQILLDGVDIREVRKSELRKAIGVVEQEGHLFAGKIQENISMFESKPDMKAVVEAARVSSLDEFVLNFPTGYGHELDYLGGGISQGQKQRILIARAAYLNPSVVVLDEATSHLDPATEAEVLGNLFEKFKGKTLIILTQRVNVARQCDLAVYLESGRVAESGNHKELVAKRGLYYRFFTKFMSIG